MGKIKEVFEISEILVRGSGNEVIKNTLVDADKVGIEWPVRKSNKEERQFRVERIRDWLKDHIVEAGDELKIPISVYREDYNEDYSVPARIWFTEPEGEVKVTNRTRISLDSDAGLPRNYLKEKFQVTRSL